MMGPLTTGTDNQMLNRTPADGLGANTTCGTRWSVGLFKKDHDLRIKDRLMGENAPFTVKQ